MYFKTVYIGDIMIYRQEHPKPQFERENWINLNGVWDFQIDKSNSGADRKLFETEAVFDSKINVPFCPESQLSGIGDTDFLNSVWYKRSFTVTSEQLSGRIVLHFGAVDYHTTVYINGKSCGEHKGGYSSFSFDITKCVVAGENVLTVHAQDDTRSALVPSGKQSHKYESFGCLYTRTTGIWQTVWLEFTPKAYIKDLKYYPDANAGVLVINATVCGAGEFKASAFFDGEPMGDTAVKTNGGFITAAINLKEKHLWEIGKGGLYDLEITFVDDKVKSYFGLRSIDYRDYKFYLNDKSVFQRLVLDQGYYPDGVYTAPSDEALKRDIELSLAMGFNGARLHEKVFEERFLYHCDRMGYIVWGEYPNWGLDVSQVESVYSILPEWLEVLNRDFNHPSIVGWCPLNETWDSDRGPQYNPVLSLVYYATKAVDNTRPCIDTSGFYHVITDIYDLHDYEKDPEKFAEHYKDLDKGEIGEFFTKFEKRQSYDGKLPFFVSEYGGIGWFSDENKRAWGYNIPKTPEEFLVKLKGLNDVLLDNDRMFGFCYTQLTDVEQEQNGLYTYDRQPKFDPEKIHPLFSRKAAVED